MKNILLPIDFSENSKQAVKYALNLYKNTACNFYFLHVYSPMIYSHEYQLIEGIYGADIPAVINDSRVKETDDFIKEVTNGFENPKSFFYKIVECNVLTDSVKNVVKERKIDVIIMGTKGVTSSSNVLFGTNTIHVINKRCCPVIVVPQNYEFTAPKDILFPTDLNVNYKERHLKTLKKIAHNFGSKIHLFHVRASELEDSQIAYKAQLKSKIEDLDYEFVFEEDKDITDAISSYQEKNTSDLLVMINNKHLFFENIFFRPLISDIVMNLKTPFLVIPA